MEAEFKAFAAFCLFMYVFLLISVASHQRQQLQTRRAKFYFWLLALFPLWSMPMTYSILQAIYYVTLHV